MKNNQLIQWSTLGFLLCMAIALAIACVWTGSYWLGDSWMAKGLRVQEGYWGSMAKILTDAGIPAAERLKLWLFVAAPVLSALLAFASVGLILLQIAGRRVWPFAAGLAGLSLLGTWLGMSALHAVEDPIFFARSPWVRSFQTNAYPVAIAGACYLLLLGVLFALKRRGSPHAT